MEGPAGGAAIAAAEAEVEGSARGAAIVACGPVVGAGALAGTFDEEAAEPLMAGSAGGMLSCCGTWPYLVARRGVEVWPDEVMIDRVVNLLSLSQPIMCLYLEL